MNILLGKYNEAINCFEKELNEFKLIANHN